MSRRPLDTSSDRDFGRPPATSDEKKRYADLMNTMFGDTFLPTVVYKGEQINRRQL